MGERIGDKIEIVVQKVLRQKGGGGGEGKKTAIITHYTYIYKLIFPQYNYHLLTKVHPSPFPPSDQPLNQLPTALWPSI